MLYTVESQKSVSQVLHDLEESAVRNHFGVLNTIDLQAKMRDKGVEFDRVCQIVEVCNPQQAKRILEGHPEISTVLPCRISIYAEKDKLILATIKPTAMINIFAQDGLEGVAHEVEKTMIKIMNEAAG